MAVAEYCLFTGKAEEAALRAEAFLAHADPALCLSAHIVCCISNVTLGHVDEAQKTLASMETLDVGNRVPISGKYCADVVRVLLHLPEKDLTTLNDIPSTLPEGVRYFLCYVLALREYLRGEYGKAEGIATAALALSEKRYPIPEIYLHVISTITLMRREHLEEATGHFAAAWEMALPDGLISPFGEHYVLLSGLNKKLIKPELQEKYQEISKYADRYFSNWITIHNSHTDQQVAPGLTKMESTVATLFSRGWSVSDIARHLDVSNNTVKYHLSETYKKLGVNRREQLRDYLLR
ncbi:MAG: LuxR C-terminal-related transcriptional regulator [Clostridia bacterium]|nr:LuxR C-terminal-related transcriptional regulator [Clostridia bacterium]